MSTVEGMIARYRELGSIASNPQNDMSVRRGATEERLNLVVLIEKAKAVDASGTIAGLVSNDPTKQFEKQNQRIADDKEHTAKVDEVLKAMAETDNEIGKALVGSPERDRLIDRVLSLRLQLDKLTTFRSA